MKTTLLVADASTVEMNRTRRFGFLRDVRRNWILWLMILPAVLYFVLFHYTTMIGFVFAFKRYRINLGLFGSPWVGFQNFRFLVLSGTLWTVTKNTVLYNIAFILIGNLLQIAAAIVLSELGSRAFKKIAQSFMFLPYFVSYVILSVLVYNVFNYESGFLNSLLVGLGMERVDLYATPGAWKYVLVTFHVWKWLGHGSVIYLAAIMTIDGSLYEAADIDGATMLQKVFRITIPALKPTIAILLLLAVGRIMRGQFELFYQIIGNNGQLYRATDIIDTFVFRSLVKTFDISMGTAAGLFQSAMGLGIILITNYIVKRLNPDYALF